MTKMDDEEFIYDLLFLEQEKLQALQRLCYMHCIDSDIYKAVEMSYKAMKDAAHTLLERIT